MKIPVNVNIKTEKLLGNPIDGSGETETRETTAYGFIHATRGGLRLEYMESAPDGDAAITTVKLIGEKLIAMNHGGGNGTYMIFEEGKTHSCVFCNGYFPMELRIRTKELKNTISKTGGRLDVNYTVDIIGSRAENSHISLSVYPHEDIITS
ncbi:MAG: DUF1934 domain-containing protein [Eubacteriales bacterium]|nr:DUF1934 domain-containing protein [Eubacteriales bacterium]